ncbi:MAG TPA: FkbM family methyltransferase [Actinomycetota bacterium]|nr:FkbM family methyltransferase [Actinomycetota bacterium]
MLERDGSIPALDRTARLTSGLLSRLILRRVLLDENVSLLLDVGANEGQFALETRRLGYRRSIVSFEPLSVPYEKLEERAAHDPRWETRRCALGRRSAKRMMGVSANSVSSSLLQIDETHLRAEPASRFVREEKVEVVRLDSLRGELVPPDAPACLKLDTQGFEMDVLAGAQRTLGQVRVVHVELLPAVLYEDQAKMPEVISVLYDAGFEMIDLNREFVDPVTRHVLACNGIFVRRP